MRFKPYPRSEYLDTSRKRGNIERGQRKERESLPLLADLIAEKQPSVDDVMAQRIAQSAKTEQSMRDHRARSWREARRQLAEYDEETQNTLLTYWNQHRWLPGDPSYLLGMLHSYDKGKLQTYATFKAHIGEPIEPIVPLSERNTSHVAKLAASREGERGR